jgi:hypothetical protein
MKPRDMEMSLVRTAGGILAFIHAGVLGFALWWALVLAFAVASALREKR